MASVERKPITGVWGQSHQQSREQSPQSGSGGEATLKLNAFSILRPQSKPQICPLVILGNGQSFNHTVNEKKIVS